MGYKDKSVKTQKQNEFIGKAYDRVNLTIKKGTKAALQEVAATQEGGSINGYIKGAVEARYKADTGKDIKL